MMNHPKSEVRIALDVMGGERGVGVHVLGAIKALRNCPGMRVSLFGDAPRIERFLKKARPAEKVRAEVRHCTEKVEMVDHPGVAARKKESSMYKCVEAVRDGTCDGAVSAGNSGAMMACSLFLLKRVEGLERPAIMVKFPTVQGYTVLLDMGANVDCKAKHLVQFAVMGETYSRIVEKVSRPRVALLSNGEERIKGNDVVRESAQLLEQLDLNFIGYVEGHDVFQHKADVIVCDGFVGNIVLKCCEGLMHSTRELIENSIKKNWLLLLPAIAMKPVFHALKTKTDPSEIGAAPLLGVQGNIFICHGTSNARAIENALYKVYEAVQENLAVKVSESTQKLAAFESSVKEMGG